MIKRKLKGIISCIVVLLIFSSSFLTTPALDPIKFNVNSINSSKGETVTVPVTVSRDFETNGFLISFKYNPNIISFCEDSVKTTQKGLNDFSIYNNATEGKLSIVWESEDNITISKDSNFLSVNFKIGQTDEVSTPVTLNIGSLYSYKFTSDGKLILSDLEVASKTVGFSIAINNDAAVEATIKAIDDIGTVEYSDISLNKINTAARLYSNLTNSQKNAVTNYQKLLDAQLEYERLKKAASEDSVDKELEKFITDNKNILTRTVSTVQIEDEEAVTKALNDYFAMSLQAQFDGFDYKTLLKGLESKIALLKKEKEDAEAAAEEEAKLRGEAEIEITSFKKDFAYFLALKEEDLVADHKEGLTNALSILNTLSSLNPYIKEGLASEKLLLQNYYDIVLKMSENAGENSDQNIVDLFKINFSYLLNLEKANATKDDEFELKLAMEIYNYQSASVQELLKNEYETLSELYDYVSNIPDIEAEIEDSETEDNEIADEQTVVEKTQVVERIKNVDTSIIQRRCGVIILYLCILLGVSVLTFVGLQIFYRTNGGKKSEIFEEIE